MEVLIAIAFPLVAFGFLGIGIIRSFENEKLQAEYRTMRQKNY